jgi:hypothetical protein
MEKITKRVMIPKYVQVQSEEFEEVEIYKTSDGLEFISFSDALEHESILKYGEEIICVATGGLISTGYSWYKARDQEELEYLIRRLSGRYIAENAEYIKAGEWFSIVYEQDSNGPDTATFVPLRSLKEDYEQLLKDLSEQYEK